MGRIHLAGISSDGKFQTRLSEIATEFEYNYKKFESVDQFAENVGDEQVSLVVFSAIEIQNSSEIAGNIQVIKQMVADAYVVVVVSKRISQDAVAFVKKSGANFIMNEQSFFESGQPEYIGSQILRGSLIPIKVSELKPNTSVDFPVLVVMPLNKKILPVVQANAGLSDVKYKKIQEAKELYIHRDDLPKFQKYVEANQDLSAAGIAARCRLKYLNLCRAHAELVFLIIDQSEHASFAKGKALLEDCERLGKDLLSNLASVEDPMAIVNNSSIGESGSLERSTSISAIAGLVSLGLVNVSPDNIVLAGLLSDFGLLELHPQTLKKIRTSGISSLSDEEKIRYQQHPTVGLNMCLSRKLPLSDKIKQIIQATHENWNGQGFPKQISDDKVPLESQIIHFTQLVDEAAIVKMGEGRKSIRDIQKSILDVEAKKPQMFSPKLVQDRFFPLN